MEPAPGLTAERVAERHGKVGSFLLASLKRSAGRYALAAEAFSNELQASRGVAWHQLAAEEQDWSLAERVVD
eukprot:4384511-Lingulodinium_polyedra.AAC.1